MTASGKAKMQANYTVTTKSGRAYKWSFEECEKDPNDYGNKCFIAVIRPSGDCFLLDCRYVRKYNFHTICVNYLCEYYGENLDELSETEDGNQ